MRGAVRQFIEAITHYKVCDAVGDGVSAIHKSMEAVRLTWDEIDFDAREINRLTQKRRKRVVLPICEELLFALEAERGRRKPQPDDRILLNPETNEPLTRIRLYHRMLALGKRAGVPNAHPHRFKDTFAVGLLARGATP